MRYDPHRGTYVGAIETNVPTSTKGQKTAMWIMIGACVGIAIAAHVVGKSRGN
jgi:hypothetical protein